MKLFRRLDIGLNPDLEIGRFLTTKEFPHVPHLAGALEYRREDGQWLSLGILSEFIPNAMDAWEYTLDTLARYYDRVQSLPLEDSAVPQVESDILKLAGREIPPLMSDLIATYQELARLLGNRTAAMHLTLASELEDKDFTVEPFTPHYQRALYQSMRNLTTQAFQTLRRRLDSIPEAIKPLARRAANSEGTVLNRFRPVFERKIKAARCRTHGDFHLGQVLYTGKDFIILDFEGEPARSISERRIKRSPLRDVAGMLRSFHYATYATLYKQMDQGIITADHFGQIEPWAHLWYSWVSAIFLKAYLEEAAAGSFLPENREEFDILLEAFLLEKAIYELGYELNNRPAWLNIPLQGLLHLIDLPALD
jgi:maltose alpha-D-glucosyltransferase / alpha-amylase